MKIFNTLLLIFIAISFFSCELFQSYEDNIEVKEIESVKLEKVEVLSRKIFLGINLKVVNTNSINIGLTNASYDVYINSNYFGKGSFNDLREIKKNADTVVNFPVSSKIEDIMLNLIQGGYKLNYKVTGIADVVVKNLYFRINFEIEEGKIIVK